MSRVLVIGGSDQGRQAIDVLEAAGVHVVVGVVDRALEVGSEVVGYPVVGSDDDLAAAVAATRADGFLVGIGDNAVRARVTGAARHACPDLELVSAIHPGAVVSRSAVVGPGTLAMAGVVVSNGCSLGTGVLLGTNSSIDHDGVVGDFASLAPGATTGGGVTIGAATAVLLGANVIHGIAIGEHTVVGAGALVLDDLPDHVVAFGVPATVRRPRAEGEPYL